MSGPPSTAINTTAPLGGCTQRNANIAPIASAAAVLAAIATSGIDDVQITPIAAETILSPGMEHGCANGLDGTANNNTAEAPIGAMNPGLNPDSM